jgi:hypothetical protein
MAGNNITTIYVLDSKEYLLGDLNEDQLAYINNIAHREKYNELRQQIITEKGADVQCTIKTYFPNQEMVVEF